METEGYLARTDDLLDVVHDAAVKHVKRCSVCKKDGPKPNLRPVERIVSHVDQVSSILLCLIKARRIFVSRRAANYLSGEA